MKISILLAAALTVGAAHAVHAASGSTEIGAKTKKFMPPGVKSISLGGVTGGKASPGATIQINCGIGFVGEKQYDSNSALAQIIAKNNYSLPFEVLVHDLVVHKSMLVGLDKPTTQYVKTLPWTVGQPFSGKTVAVECRVDPANIVHQSSQKTWLTVTGTPQKELTTNQPGGEKVMANPKPVLRQPDMPNNPGLSRPGETEGRQTPQQRR